MAFFIIMNIHPLTFQNSLAFIPLACMFMARLGPDLEAEAAPSFQEPHSPCVSEHLWSVGNSRRRRRRAGAGEGAGAAAAAPSSKKHDEFRPQISKTRPPQLYEPFLGKIGCSMRRSACSVWTLEDRISPFRTSAG